VAPAALAEPRAWLDELEQFWGHQLQAFKAHAEGSSAKARRGSR
jgi:hypothetical protein